MNASANCSKVRQRVIIKTWKIVFNVESLLRTTKRSLALQTNRSNLYQIMSVCFTSSMAMSGRVRLGKVGFNLHQCRIKLARYRITETCIWPLSIDIGVYTWWSRVHWIFKGAVRPWPSPQMLLSKIFIRKITAESTGTRISI